MSTHRSRSSCCKIVATTLVCVVTLLVARTLRAAPATAAKDTDYQHVPVSLWLIPQISSNGLANDRLYTNFSLALGVSGYARLRGVDLSLGASWVQREMSGLQASVGLNYVGQRASGAQLAVGANVVAGQATGLQASSGYNHAGALRGVQLGLVGSAREITGGQIGLLNIGGKVRGAQIGLINIGGKVRGSQIGLINLAEDSDAPVGLINLVKNGQHHLELWSSDTAPLNVGVKLGGRYVYSVLGVGLQPGEEKTRWMLGLGLGGHVPISRRFFLEMDAVAWQINDDQAWTDELNILGKLRVIGGYSFARHFSVFAGATLNVLTTRVDDGADFGLIRGRRVTSDDAETTVRIWPGFVAGMRI